MGECILTRRAGKSLPALSNPAKAAQILKDYQAIDQNGSIINGNLMAATKLSRGYIWNPWPNDTYKVSKNAIIIPTWNDYYVKVYILPLKQSICFSLRAGAVYAEAYDMSNSVGICDWDEETGTLTAPDYKINSLAIFS